MSLTLLGERVRLFSMAWVFAFVVLESTLMVTAALACGALVVALSLYCLALWHTASALFSRTPEAVFDDQTFIARAYVYT